MKYTLAFFIAIHGAIHLAGFAKSLAGNNIQQITKEVSRPIGILWLFTALVFIATTVLIVVGKNWWYTGIIAVVLSQLLIVAYWQSAKWGSALNMVIAICLVVNYAVWHFYAVADKQAIRLLSYNSGSKAVVTEDMLRGLPASVQNWLMHSGIVGKENMYTVRLKQKGLMRTEKDGKWMSADAVQYFATGKPSFIWIAKIRSGPFLHISGKDASVEGKGHMVIRVLSLFSFADASGPEIDQGTLVRYLAEIQWFPSAALSPCIKWESISATAAKATMTLGGVMASGIFTFNDKNDITCFEAQRYMEQKGHYSLETWVVPVTGYKEFNGVRVPAKGTAIWKLKAGDFEWFNWEITDIAYNTSSTYRMPW